MITAKYVLEDSVSLANRILSECGDYKELESKLADLYDSFMSARADKPSSSMELAKKNPKISGGKSLWQHYDAGYL